MSLYQLPQQRQKALLWRHVLELDYAGVNELVREASKRECRWRWVNQLAGEPTAILGTDGRYHLCSNGIPVCTERRPRPGNPYRHEQTCIWWKERTGYRLTAPPSDPDRPPRRRTVRWTFRLTSDSCEPWRVSPAARCDHEHNSRREWPAYNNPNTDIGRIRISLTEHLGPHCHACHRRPGQSVDHDHFTGLVRGMLCIHCNTHIDTCPHLSGCPWADYLNDPPAAHLALHYPKMAAFRRNQRAKIAQAGYDPFSTTDTRTC